MRNEAEFDARVLEQIQDVDLTGEEAEKALVEEFHIHPAALGKAIGAAMDRLVKRGLLTPPKRACEIVSYFHCGRCMAEKQRPNIAVGVNASGSHLQVWCENHQISLGKFELKEAQPPEPCAQCAKGLPHVH
jgi:hypothetical protein